MNTVGPTYGDSSDGADRHDTAQRDKRLVDEAMEAYVAWREACTRVNEAFLVWSRRCGFNAGVAFGGYTAALDREERTAACYARVLERVSDVVGRADAYLEPRPARAREASQR